MTAFPEALSSPALSADEVRRWFELETPVDIIDVQLMRAVQSMRRPDIDLICEVLAVVDQYHRRGALDKAQFKRLKGRVERFAVAGAPQPRPHVVQPAANDPLGDAPGVAAVNRAVARVQRHEVEFDSDGDNESDNESEIDGESDAEVSRALPPVPATRAAPPLAKVLPFTPAMRPGTVLRDRYVINELLGEGGMSSVYRATDRRREGLPGHDGNIAIKVLRPSLNARPEAIKSLRLEYERAQSLSHPSIVNVFGIDTDGDMHFITMELLRGELLSDIVTRLRPASLQRDQALEILRKLGVAIAYAHEQGVVHADIKPGNVMITQDGELRLFDFGAAWLAQREPWIYEAMQRSLQGATPTYASPERLTGGAPTIRDDIFSFSCLAYELLSGAHPFDRRPANLARDANSRPARIPGLSQRQWKALRRGLSWQRQDRFGDLRELLRDLDPHPQRRSRYLNLVQLHAATAPRQSRVAGLAMLLAGFAAFAAAHLLRAETPLHIVPAAVQPWVGGILRWLAQVLPGVR